MVDVTVVSLVTIVVAFFAGKKYGASVEQEIAAKIHADLQATIGKLRADLAAIRKTL